MPAIPPKVSLFAVVKSTSPGRSARLFAPLPTVMFERTTYRPVSFALPSAANLSMSKSEEKVPRVTPGSKARFGSPSWITVLSFQLRVPLVALPAEENHSPGV